MSKQQPGGYEERNNGRVNPPHFPKPPMPDGNDGRSNPPTYGVPPQPKKWVTPPRYLKKDSHLFHTLKSIFVGDHYL